MSKCFVNYGNVRSKRVFARETVDEKRKLKHEDVWYGDTSNIKNYIRSKLKMLRNEMLIEPTEDEIRHLLELKTYIAIDNAVHSIIERHWSKW